MKAIEALAQIRLNLTSVEHFLSIASGLADDNPAIREGVYAAAKETRESALLIDHLRNLFSHQQSIEAQQSALDPISQQQLQHDQLAASLSQSGRGAHNLNRLQLEQNSLLFSYSNQQTLVRAAKCLAANVAKVLYLTDSVVLQSASSARDPVSLLANSDGGFQRQHHHLAGCSQETTLDFVGGFGQLHQLGQTPFAAHQRQSGFGAPDASAEAAADTKTEATAAKTPPISDRLDNVANYSQLLRSFGELSTELVDLGKCIMLSQLLVCHHQHQHQTTGRCFRSIHQQDHQQQQRQQQHSSQLASSSWHENERIQRRNSAQQELYDSYNGSQMLAGPFNDSTGWPWPTSGCLNGAANQLAASQVRQSASTNSILLAAARGFGVRADFAGQQEYNCSGDNNNTNAPNTNDAGQEEDEENTPPASCSLEELLQWQALQERQSDRSQTTADRNAGRCLLEQLLVAGSSSAADSKPSSSLLDAPSAAGNAGATMPVSDDQQGACEIERAQSVEAQIQDMQILFQVNRLIIDRSILLLLSASKCCLRPGNECLRGLEARRSIVAQIRASISIIMAIVKCSVFSKPRPAPTSPSGQPLGSSCGLANFAANASSFANFSGAGCCCCQAAVSGFQLAPSKEQPRPTANALAASTVAPVNTNCAQAVAASLDSNGPQRDNQFDYHYLACQSPFSGVRQALPATPATVRYQQHLNGGNAHQAHLRAAAGTGQRRPLPLQAARQQQESSLQIMDYFLRTWSGAQSAHDAISKLQLIVGRLTRVSNYKCLVRALDETFAQRQLEQQLQLEQLKLQSRAKSDESPSSCLGGPFYAQTGSKETMVSSCSAANGRPFRQRQQRLQFDRHHREQELLKREQASSTAAMAAAAAVAPVASTTTFMLMNKRELIGTLNSVFLGELRSVLIERAHEFTDCAYTKHEHRETIILLLQCVKFQLNKLVKLLYRLRRKSSTINELNLGQLRQLAIHIEETCAELKYELQTVVIEQGDELDRCNAQLDLIKQLKHHCLVGDSAKAQRCCSQFLEQSEQLVELCKMLNQVAPTHKMKITTKSLGIWFDLNAGQLLATARCLADSPRSRVLKDCAWAYIQVWCSFYDDFCQLARQLAYLTHAHYDPERAARVAAWRDQVQLRRQLAAEAANAMAADELDNYGGQRLLATTRDQRQQQLEDNDDPLAHALGRSSAGCLTSNPGRSHNDNSATIETLSDITDSPRSLDHYYGFGANYQQQRRVARGHRQAHCHQQSSTQEGSPTGPFDMHHDNAAFGSGCNECGDDATRGPQQEQPQLLAQQQHYAPPEEYSMAGGSGSIHQQPPAGAHHNPSRLHRASDYLGSLQHSGAAAQQAQNLFKPANNSMMSQQHCVIQQQQLQQMADNLQLPHPPRQPILEAGRRVVINEAAPTLLQPAAAQAASGSRVRYSQYQPQQQSGVQAHHRSRHHPHAGTRGGHQLAGVDLTADPSMPARRHQRRQQLEAAEPARATAPIAPETLTSPTSASYLSAAEEAESECDTEATNQLASGGTNTDQQSSTTTEADKWSDSDADAIVRGAKEIAQMALSMYQFTKGEGDLNTTQDLFTQAELFAEEANELYKEVRCFSYKVPAGELKKELLSQLGTIPALVQQLQFIVKNPTVGKPATFAKVDSVIRETRALMEAVNRVVTATLSCRQHYNMAIASMRKRTRTLSPSYRGDKGFEFENHSSARQSAIGGRHGVGSGGMGSEPDI